jgi:hypothetical protein
MQSIEALFASIESQIPQITSEFINYYNTMKSIYTLLLLASASTVEEGAQDSNKIAANEN